MASLPLLSSHTELEDLILSYASVYSPLLRRVCHRWRVSIPVPKSRVLATYTLLEHLCTTGDIELLTKLKLKHLSDHLIESTTDERVIAHLQTLGMTRSIPSSPSVIRETRFSGDHWSEAVQNDNLIRLQELYLSTPSAVPAWLLLNSCSCSLETIKYCVEILNCCPRHVRLFDYTSVAILKYCWEYNHYCHLCMSRHYQELNALAASLTAGDLECIKFVVETLHPTVDEARRALRTSIDKDYPAIFEYLDSVYPGVSMSGLNSVVSNGLVRCLKYLLDHYVFKDSGGIKMAVYPGIDILKLLLERGLLVINRKLVRLCCRSDVSLSFIVSLNVKDLWSQGCLDNCMAYGHLSILQYVYEELELELTEYNQGTIFDVNPSCERWFLRRRGTQ